MLHGSALTDEILASLSAPPDRWRRRCGSALIARRSASTGRRSRRRGSALMRVAGSHGRERMSRKISRTTPVSRVKCLSGFAGPVRRVAPWDLDSGRHTFAIDNSAPPCWIRGSPPTSRAAPRRVATVNNVPSARSQLVIAVRGRVPVRDHCGARLAGSGEPAGRFSTVVLQGGPGKPGRQQPGAPWRQALLPPRARFAGRSRRAGTNMRAYPRDECCVRASAVSPRTQRASCARQCADGMVAAQALDIPGARRDCGGA